MPVMRVLYSRIWLTEVIRVSGRAGRKVESNDGNRSSEKHQGVLCNSSVSVNVVVEIFSAALMEMIDIENWTDRERR